MLEKHRHLEKPTGNIFLSVLARVSICLLLFINCLKVFYDKKFGKIKFLSIK